MGKWTLNKLGLPQKSEGNIHFEYIPGDHVLQEDIEKFYSLLVSGEFYVRRNGNTMTMLKAQRTFVQEVIRRNGLEGKL